MGTTGPQVLRGMDRAAFAMAFATLLRARGVAVGLTGAADFVRALEAAPPTTRSTLYWAARTTLVRRHSEIPTFDAVFAAVFDDATLEMDPYARRTPFTSSFSADDSLAPSEGTAVEEQDGTGLPWATLPRTVGVAEDSDSDLAIPQRLPSEVAGLTDVAFELLSPREAALLGRWLELALRTWPTRRSRRLAQARGGRRVALRATIARSRRTGFEPIHLVHVDPVDIPRRVVLLCDVSQSMQAQAVAYLHLMRAFTVTTDAEVFAFATTLTRLTAVLAHRSAEVAIAGATATVDDRFGGTRIASNLAALLRSHHGESLRGAVVVIASDGWDSDSPEELATAMARLRRRAHRVVWVNPRAAAPGFEPTVSTMAAALPFCDALLPGDDFASLAQVVVEVSRCAGRHSPTSSRASHGSRA
jgi:uncharacterized protein with von Willebrand factor type A (vWA) domain